MLLEALPKDPSVRRVVTFDGGVLLVHKNSLASSYSAPPVTDPPLAQFSFNLVGDTIFLTTAMDGKKISTKAVSDELAATLSKNLLFRQMTLEFNVVPGSSVENSFRLSLLQSKLETPSRKVNHALTTFESLTPERYRATFFLKGE